MVGKNVNYLKHTALLDNKLTLKFKYNLGKIQNSIIVNKNFTKYIFDIKGGSLPSTQDISQYRHKSVKAFRIGQYNKQCLRVVIEAPRRTRFTYSVNGKILTINLPVKESVKKPPKKVVTAPKISRVIKKNRVVKKNIKRATTPIPYISKKRSIIIDAGHGGRDRGAGWRDIKEKDITLTIAKKLRRKLQRRGYRVIMTRTRDKYLSLKERTEFANRHRGDIFISVHANAAPKKRVRGVLYKGIEVFYLSLHNSKRVKNKRAKYKGKSIYSRSSYRQMTSRLKIKKSRKLCKNIQREIIRSVRRKYSVVDKGIKRSDFWVLLATKMPSILIETGYITDRYEGRRLMNSYYQNLLVNGIVKGVDNYYK